MPGPTITINLAANTGAASKNVSSFFEQLRKQADAASLSVNTGMKAMSDSINSISVGIASLVGVNAIKGFIDEALKAKQAFGSLDTALKSSGQFSEQYSAELKIQQEELSKKTKLQTEDVALVQQRLVTLGVERDMMAQATKATIDYAEAVGVDAATAAQQLGVALQGDTVGALRKFKIEIDTSKPKAEQIAEMFRKLSVAVSGQAAAAYAIAPAWFSLGKAANDLKQNLGGIVLDSGILSGLNSMVEALRDLPGWVLKTSLAAGGLAAAFVIGNSAVGLLSSAFIALKFLLVPVITYFNVWIGLIGEGAAIAITALGMQLAGVIVAFVAVKKTIDLASSAMERWNALSERDSAEAQKKVADLELQKDIREKINSMLEDGSMETKDGKMYLDILNQQTQAVLKQEMSWESYHERLLSVARSVERIVAKQKEVNLGADLPKLSSSVAIAYEKGYARLAQQQLQVELESIEKLHNARKISDSDYISKKKELTSRQIEWELQQSIVESDAIANQKLKAEGDSSLSQKDKAAQLDALSVRLVELQYDREILLQKAKIAGIKISEDEARIKVSNAERIANATSKEFEASKNNVSLQLNAVDKNWRLTEDEKLAQRLPLLEKQIELDQQEVDAWDSLASSFEKGTEERQKYEDLASQAQQRLESDYQARSEAGDSPDPNSLFDQLTLKMLAIKQQWASMARNMADAISGVVTNSVNGLASALTNIIMGTQSVGAAIAQMGQQVLSSFIQQVLTAILWAKLAIPILTALGVLSGGTTAATGAAVTGAALASGASMAARFADGGPVTRGTGPRSDDVLIRASRGEYVVNAEAVQYYGQGLLDALNARMIDAKQFAEGMPSGVSMPVSGGAYASGGVVDSGVTQSINISPAPVNVAIVDNEQKLKDYMEAQGHKLVISYLNKNRRKLGLV